MKSIELQEVERLDLNGLHVLGPLPQHAVDDQQRLLVSTAQRIQVALARDRVEVAGIALKVLVQRLAPAARPVDQQQFERVSRAGARDRDCVVARPSLVAPMSPRARS
ncbi:MAG TPA: hypothetical protein VGL52_12330 [Casimicrobiaceae bacterium]|nr:hypothetical protein [Casimicrobiaceae bacterium]